MAADKPQYQHFIPQFILKNFDHPFVCPRSSKPGSRCKKRHHKKGKHPGDRVVNCLQLIPEGFKIEEHSIKRVCGLHEMYTDPTPTAKFPRQLEEKFGKLENRASHIVRHIIKCHQEQDSVKLTRIQQTTLRKFVYLQKQRSSGFYKTYNHESIDDYDINDRALLRDFMTKKGIHRPIDVWLQGLSSIIDLEMDVNKVWVEILKATVYPGISRHFQEHITEFWMSFCTLLDENEEFILTDTAYSIYEGPTDDYQDAKTGEWLRLGPRFHMFAPISPRVMVILRSNHLPEPLEDSIADRSADRKMWRQIEIDSVYGVGKTSILEDLPVHKAFNSYSHIVDGKWVMRQDWDRQLRQTDTFTFPFFKISTQHGRIISGLLLDHAFNGSTIIFDRKGPFLDLLEWFLTEPCEVGKRLGGEQHEDQEKYIERLTALMHVEGRNITVNTTSRQTWHHLDIERFRNQTIHATRWLEEIEKGHVYDKQDEVEREEVPTNDPNPDDEGLGSWKTAANQWLESLEEKSSEIEPIGNNSNHPAGGASDQTHKSNPQGNSEHWEKDSEEQNVLDPTAKYGDGSREDLLVPEIHKIIIRRWRSPSFGHALLSARKIQAGDLAEAEVMFRVWLINGQLDLRKDIPATNRLGRLLERFQSQQPTTLFWLFLKVFRYTIWSQEHGKPTAEAELEEWDWEGPEDKLLNSKVDSLLAMLHGY
ncbi:Ff.00g107570.m01.CDS01 [Fusarium sp. VM40]|nr:Ff.00g107570.m01.CDS01 [Fusarium sp. VM40]